MMQLVHRKCTIHTRFAIFTLFSRIKNYLKYKLLNTMVVHTVFYNISRSLHRWSFIAASSARRVKPGNKLSNQLDITIIKYSSKEYLQPPTWSYSTIQFSQLKRPIDSRKSGSKLREGLAPELDGYGKED